MGAPLGAPFPDLSCGFQPPEEFCSFPGVQTDGPPAALQSPLCPQSSELCQKREGMDSTAAAGASQNQDRVPVTRKPLQVTRSHFPLCSSLYYMESHAPPSHTHIHTTHTHTHPPPEAALITNAELQIKVRFITAEKEERHVQPRKAVPSSHRHNKHCANRHQSCCAHFMWKTLWI